MCVCACACVCVCVRACVCACVCVCVWRRTSGRTTRRRASAYSVRTRRWPAPRTARARCCGQCGRGCPSWPSSSSSRSSFSSSTCSSSANFELSTVTRRRRGPAGTAPPPPWPSLPPPYRPPANTRSVPAATRGVGHGACGSWPPSLKICSGGSEYVFYPLPHKMSHSFIQNCFP